VTRYFIAYERNDTKIVPEELKLEKGGDYEADPEIRARS
jgi:hypothetical protein